MECRTNSDPAREVDRFAPPLRHHQRRRVRHRQRAQQDRVHEAVDRRVRADSERERHGGQQREHAVLEHRPQAVPDVLRQLLEQDPRPQRARVFPQERHVAKVAARGPSRLLFRQSVGLAFIRFLGKMELQLLAELVFLAPPLHPPCEFSKERGHRPSSSTGFNSNPMARANASHLDCSLVNCFRPRGVIR